MQIVISFLYFSCSYLNFKSYRNRKRSISRNCSSNFTYVLAHNVTRSSHSLAMYLIFLIINKLFHISVFEPSLGATLEDILIFFQDKKQVIDNNFCLSPVYKTNI